MNPQLKQLHEKGLEIFGTKECTAKAIVAELDIKTKNPGVTAREFLKHEIVKVARPREGASPQTYTFMPLEDAAKPAQKKAAKPGMKAVPRKKAPAKRRRKKGGRASSKAAPIPIREINSINKKAAKHQQALKELASIDAQIAHLEEERSRLSRIVSDPDLKRAAEAARNINKFVGR